MTDAAPQDAVCARIGGDNFTVMYRNYGRPPFPEDLVATIQSRLQAVNLDFSSSIFLSVSAGYCQIPDDGDSFPEIFERSEFALRMAKTSHSHIRRYDDRVRKVFVGQTEIEHELTKAINDQHLVLFYQPMVDLETKQLAATEALIRWRHPSGRLIPPDEFIPVAERSHLIIQISRFVLYEACRQNKAWQDAGLPPRPVSVNLTAADFYQTDVCETVRQALDDAGLEPCWLEIELTERLALTNVEQAIMQMDRLRQLGVKISMDDFGTGYSSLSYIQRLPIDVLKLDRSFIMKLDTDNVSREIVAAVLRIARSKTIKTVAEGVETAKQAEILRVAGCDYGQGYYFGRPVPGDDLVRLPSWTLNS